MVSAPFVCVRARRDGPFCQSPGSRPFGTYSCLTRITQHGTKSKGGAEAPPIPWSATDGCGSPLLLRVSGPRLRLLLSTLLLLAMLLRLRLRLRALLLLAMLLRLRLLALLLLAMLLRL